MTAWVLLALTGFTLASLATDPGVKAAALSLVAPGAGFLVWAAGNPLLALAGLLISGSLFAAALLSWFATGNVLAPPIAWLVAAIGAATAGFGQLDANASAVWSGAPAALASGVLVALIGGISIAMRSAPRSDEGSAPWAATIDVPHSRKQPELNHEDWQRIRLLLDRALQPVEAFEGFEWRDQFQTAAIRYQLNFLSIALSTVQAFSLPALQGCLLEAQRRLRAKQSDSRIWGYWRWENLWGNLRLGADPVARDNIMYSGFVAAQITLANGATGGRMGDGTFSLDLETRGGRRFVYSQDALIDSLARQYRAAPFGLLACEPNWIYPLCNLITATALRAHDAQHGTECWSPIAPGFRLALERGFTRSDGRLVPFRSSLTGLAPPPLGGAVMSAFPCFFLNALFPDLSSVHWARFRAAVATRPGRRAFWPVDVGNYGLSRASSFSASAAAATEMGDAGMAAHLLAELDRSCPSILVDGVRHRPRASLWAHALEIIARHGRMNGLRDLAAIGADKGGPHIEDAPYPALFVSAAHSVGETLRATFFPCEQSGEFELQLAGLRPDQAYRCAKASNASAKTDASGRARIRVNVTGRTELHLVPAG